MILFFIFFVFLNLIDCYKVTFKKFIDRKILENTYSGESDTIEILNSVKKSAVHIKKILSLSYLESIQLVNNNYNIHDEKQKKLDVLSNSIIKNSLMGSNKVSSLCSEEENDEKIINMRTSKKLIFVYDPLDGSSNIESSMPMGTIFGLYKDSINFDDSLTSINRLNNMVLGGYILYSSSVHLVFYFENNVYHFIYDEDIKDFILYNDKLKTPVFNKIYSINEAKINNFDTSHKLYLDKLKNDEYSCRYYGCLVADFHNILINGGIFLYPSDIINKKNKLRLLYEAKPLAKIMEQTGGICSDGNKRITTKYLHSIHDTTPLYFGSINNLNDYFNFTMELENNISNK
tara:strand:- start:898 stop:1935 length:1038 start_codon:yes stop_codon:yes gene_type:complete